LNGEPITNRFWITHRELTSGGVLAITLGPRPNTQWGVVRQQADPRP
jgi:putative alpha-1,2-mannosidase